MSVTEQQAAPPFSPSTPSSSVSSWFTTRSVTPVESWPRCGAMASNSSKNSTHGAAAAARLRAAVLGLCLHTLDSASPCIGTTADKQAAWRRGVLEGSTPEDVAHGCLAGADVLVKQLGPADADIAHAGGRQRG